MRYIIFYIATLLLITSYNIAQNIQWRHFDQQALELSQKEKKPILLHLAANWCHWCHVMEEKTYHHPQVIQYLNQNFIACTEDHDQRPDLANRYRDYGWPATIIFSYDGKEIFKQAGYIEANEFLQILKDAYSGKLKPEEKKSSYTSNPSSAQINLKAIQKDVFNGIDLKMGGFQSPQKSLDFEMFEYAFNHYQNDTLKKWLRISIKNSLDLIDKEWGGVYQYSTHGDWKHPHYEKLLSIQARYIKMYLWYFYLSKDSTYFKAAIKNYHYVNRFFKKKNHTFANAQDADLIKGKKAHDYFALSDKQRTKLGIPSIDTNTFTDNNSKMAESLIYLYAYTGDKSYLNTAIATIEYILNNRQRPDGLYNHGYTNDLTPAIVDQIYLVKTLFLLHRTIGVERYAQIAKNILNLIIQKFFNGQCITSYVPLTNYLYPDCIVSENIETARILNLYGKIYHHTEWIQTAQKIADYLLTDEVYDKIIIEPGILSLIEEINSEPYSAIYIVKDLNKKDYSIHRYLLQTPKFYLNTYLMTEMNILDDKKEIWEAFNENTTVFCTPTFCSSPMNQITEIENFVRSRILKN